MFDAEAIVIEAISDHTGVDPSDFSTTTKLRDSRAIRPEELKAIVAEIEEAVGRDLVIADIRTIGELVDLVERLGPV